MKAKLCDACHQPSRPPMPKGQLVRLHAVGALMRMEHATIKVTVTPSHVALCLRCAAQAQWRLNTAAAILQDPSADPRLPATPMPAEWRPEGQTNAVKATGDPNV